MGRPTFGARRDKNDDVVRRVIKNNKWEKIVKVVDISRLGNMVDRLIYMDDFCFGVEIKQSRKCRLTKGEKEYPGLVFIVTSEEDFTQIIVALLPIIKKMSKIPLPKVLRKFLREEDANVKK